tara:strand:+ start:695 stop:847 length:153 start_codon:yes stop_codon:yes gene_type:complete
MKYTQPPRDIIGLEILILDDEKQVLRGALDKLYKDKKISKLTVRRLYPSN